METFRAGLALDWQITLPFLILYLATTCLDVLFGLIVAFSHKRLCSTISRGGMMRKAMMLGTIMLASLFDGILPAVSFSAFDVDFLMTFGALGCVWWLVHEILSITEHCAILGLPMPKRLKDALAVIQDSFDGHEHHGADTEAAADPMQTGEEKPDQV